MVHYFVAKDILELNNAMNTYLINQNIICNVFLLNIT